MKELAKFLITRLVDSPDRVELTSTEEGDVTRFSVRVADEEKGKIIGKQGKVVKAIRQVMGIAGAKAKRKVFLDVE
jgi:predicted RNA-binding protein YlqC (UPF0109 family)